MPLYSYQYISPQGKKQQASLEAQDERSARDLLRSQGILIVKIEKKEGLSRRQNLKESDLLTFSLQLAQLVEAKVPLYDSLMTIESQYRGERCHRILLSLCEALKSGSSLSEAMSQFPKSFDSLYVSLIKSGEQSGSIDAVLRRITQFLKRRAKLKRQLSTAMIYPAILGGFACLILIMLLTFVIPSIEAIFEGRQLNQFTEFVLKASHFLQDYWWLLFPSLAGIGFFTFKQLETPKGKEWKDRLILKLPLLRTLAIKSAYARFSETMATLLMGGLPMIEALRLSEKVMNNSILEAEVKLSQEGIIMGSYLSREFSKSQYVPPLVPKMLAVGEETGSIGPIFVKIAEMYEDDVEKTIDKLMALMQPGILIIMGGIIGAIIMAILLPLMDMTSFTM